VEGFVATAGATGAAAVWVVSWATEAVEFEELEAADEAVTIEDPPCCILTVAAFALLCPTAPVGTVLLGCRVDAEEPVA